MTDLSPEKWTCLSNDVLDISIEEPRLTHKFKPIFTYPIFGDSETIFGYQNLIIDLKFDCESLLPLLKVSYDAKLPNVDCIDPQLKLLEFLPLETLVNDSEYELLFNKQKFSIPGEIINQYKENGNEFTIYKTSLADASTVKLHLRLQIFVLLFIEAGSYIDETDSSWDIYLIYKTNPSEKPCIVGFCTAYNYFWYQGHQLHDLDDFKFTYRKKISQFVILPPFQKQGHGQHLYNSMFSLWYNDDSVKEICVEDPNESFDDLRDRCDLIRLSGDKKFITKLIELPTLPYSTAWFNELKNDQKLEKRQFDRLLEMFYLNLVNLKQLPYGKKQVRLQIKKRLYWKNKDSLLELDLPQQRDKLQNAFEGLEQDYLRIMNNIDLKLTNKRPIE